MSNPSRFNPTTLIIFIAVVIAAIAGYIYVTGQEPEQTTVEENVTPEANTDDTALATGGIELGSTPYSLNGTNGETISATSFPDKYKLIYFGFTRCPDMCPTALTNITAAMKTLGADADKIQPIFITVDPEHDTDQVIKDYLYNFDKHFVGATGTAEQIKAAQDSFRVYASKVSPPEAVEETAEATHDDHDMQAMQGMNHDDHASHDTAAMPAMSHSDYIYLMDKNGKLLNVFPGNTDGASIASNIQTVLAAKMMPSAAEGDLPPAPDSVTPDSSAATDAAPDVGIPAPDASTPEAPTADQTTTE